MFPLFSVPFVSPWGQRMGSQDTAGPTPPGVPWRQRGFKSHPQGYKWVAQDLASGLAPGKPHPMHTPENTRGTRFYRHSVLQMPLGKLRKSPPWASFQGVWALSPRSNLPLGETLCHCSNQGSKWVWGTWLAPQLSSDNHSERSRGAEVCSVWKTKSQDTT